MSRLTVEFPEEIDKILDKRAQEEKTTKREVIRRALALYDYVSEQGVRPGGERKLSITEKDDTVVKDIVF